jgi:hypothetical protein
MLGVAPWDKDVKHEKIRFKEGEGNLELQLSPCRS